MDYNANAAEESKRIVRRFSYHERTRNSKNILTKSVIEQEEHDEELEKFEVEQSRHWQELLQPLKFSQLNGLSELERSSYELASTWKDFCARLPNGHKWKSGNRPSLNDVVAEVHNARGRLIKDREHSITGKFQRFCNKIDRFKDVFAFVPQQDKYVCLVAGSITAIIKAAVNHRETMEGISHMLCDLSEDMPFWQRQLEAHPRNDFLKQIFEQVSKLKRALQSFDNSIKGIIEEKKNRLRDLSQRMERECVLESVQAMKEFQENQSKATESVQGQLNIITRCMSQTLLRDCAADRLTMKQCYEIARITSTKDTSSGSDTEDPTLTKGPEPHYRHVIKESVSHLDSSDARKLWDRLLEESHHLVMHPQTFQQFRRWMSSPASETLWIYGESPNPSMSSNARVAGYVANITAASGTGAAVLGHSCPSRKTFRVTKRGLQAAFMDLLCSLIVQLVELLPDEFNTPKDMNNVRFSALDRSITSASASISLVHDLLMVQQRHVVCIIIDGLESLSFDIEIEEQTAKLAKILSLPHTSFSMGQEKVVKTLFTTNQFCRGLRFLRPNDRFEVPQTKGKAMEFGDVDHFTRLKSSS